MEPLVAKQWRSEGPRNEPEPAKRPGPLEQRIESDTVGNPVRVGTEECAIVTSDVQNAVPTGRIRPHLPDPPRPEEPVERAKRRSSDPWSGGRHPSRSRNGPLMEQSDDRSHREGC